MAGSHGGQIKVNFNATKTASDDFTELSGHIKDEAKQLNNAQEIAAEFQGDVFGALSQLLQEGCRDLGSVADSVGKTGDSLNQALNSFVATDAASAAEFEGGQS